MAAYKYTMLLQLTTKSTVGPAPIQRIGAWSESWYDTSSPSTANINAFKRLMQKRVNLMGIGGLSTGFRIQQVDPRGSSQQQASNFPAPQNWQTDTPGTSLLVTFGSAGVPNVRREKFAGLPDSQVYTGEFQPSPDWQYAAAQFFDELVGWKFRGRDFSQPLFNLATIAADGTYTAQAGVPFVQGDTVVVRRAFNSLKQGVGGTFVVGSIISGTSGVLNKWTKGACTLGTITKYVPQYFPISLPLISISRVTFRKVGRPFVGYRGRRSKKKT